MEAPQRESDTQTTRRPGSEPTRRGFGLLINMLIGILGALLGELGATFLGLNPLGALTGGLVGAGILLTGVGFVRRH
jgi:uncharacterized membrane protein YeaQ/YmgE (transglycosylase-associated protein family)